MWTILDDLHILLSSMCIREYEGTHGAGVIRLEKKEGEGEMMWLHVISKKMLIILKSDEWKIVNIVHEGNLQKCKQYK